MDHIFTPLFTAMAKENESTHKMLQKNAPIFLEEVLKFLRQKIDEHLRHTVLKTMYCCQRPQFVPLKVNNETKKKLQV